MASSLQLQDTLNFVGPYISFYPLTVVNDLQPALGMCNAVAQVMLAPPFRHRFNRNSINFITTSGVQTYMNAASWAANTRYNLGTVIIDSNGNGQKVIVAGTSGGSTPTWPTGIFLTVTDGSSSPVLTWQNIGALVSIPQINDMGYIEKAQIQDVNNGNVWKDLNISLDLPRDTQTSCPKYIAAQSDDNLGDIALRLVPPPGAAYPVGVQYQKQQTLFTSISQSWAPIPDYMFYVYSFGVLALAFLYKGDPRFAWASQQFVTRMLAFAEGLNETQINQFLRNWEGTQTFVLAQKAQQGVSARSIG